MVAIRRYMVSNCCGSRVMVASFPDRHARMPRIVLCSVSNLQISLSHRERGQGSQDLCCRLIGLESFRRTCEGRERHRRIGCWCQISAMALTIWATHMRRGGQTAETLGLEEFLLRLCCQGGGMCSH